MRHLDFIKSLTVKPVIKEHASYEAALLARLEHQANKLHESEDAVDAVTMDIPLLIRLLEYAKEDAKTDMDLHSVAERLTQLSKSATTLSMNDYNHIVDIQDAASPQPEQQDENLDVSMIRMLAGIKK
jgi:hypothetical protein